MDQRAAGADCRQGLPDYALVGGRSEVGANVPAAVDGDPNRRVLARRYQAVGVQSFC